MHPFEIMSELAELLYLVMPYCECEHPGCKDCANMALGKILVDNAKALSKNDVSDQSCNQCLKCHMDKIRSEGQLGPAVFISCPKCGNKRCHKAEWHAWKCTGSNDPRQIKEQDTPQPPQDTPAGGRTGATPLQDLLDRIPIWEEGPAENGTIPEPLPDKIITYAVVKIAPDDEFVLLYFVNEIGRWAYIEDEIFDSWEWVEKWLILK